MLCMAIHTIRGLFTAERYDVNEVQLTDDSNVFKQILQTLNKYNTLPYDNMNHCFYSHGWC